MDISLNKLIQFYLNNTLNLRPLTTQITSCYTHKMAIVNIEHVTSFHPLYRRFFDSPNAFSGRAPSGPTRELLDPVVDRVGRNDRLGCFFDRLDRLHRLVDDFTTRLDLADFLSTWSTCGHFDHNYLLVLAHWQLTRKILCPST